MVNPTDVAVVKRVGDVVNDTGLAVECAAAENEDALGVEPVRLRYHAVSSFAAEHDAVHLGEYKFASAHGGVSGVGVI